jgi:ribosomal protein S18 acetylase RimI-like enzyme
MAAIREADLPGDLESVERLWLEYLTWGNDGLEERYGFRLPVRESVERDLESVAKFQPPDGRLLLGFDGDAAVAIACMQRIGPATAEVKRMYVQPSHRRAGLGRAMLDELIASAASAGYERIRLDSPHFMTAAHGLYRSRGFAEIEPYPESEIPDEHKSHWIFMERVLG